MHIYNFEEYVPDSEGSNYILIAIKNIYNPNKKLNSNLGYLKLSTIVKNTITFKDSNSAVTSLETTTAPGWATLVSITSTNLYARKKADYEFTLRTYAKIPDSNSLG